jgi:hypothetical protein
MSSNETAAYAKEATSRSNAVNKAFISYKYSIFQILAQLTYIAIVDKDVRAAMLK